MSITPKDTIDAEYEDDDKPMIGARRDDPNDGYPADLGGHSETRQAWLMVGFSKGDGSDGDGENELMLRSETGLLVTMDRAEALELAKHLLNQLTGADPETVQVWLKGLLEVEKRDDLPDVEPAVGTPDPGDWRNDPEAIAPLAMQQVEPGLWVFQSPTDEVAMLVRRLMFLQPGERSMLHEFTAGGRALIKNTPVRMLQLVGGLDPWWGATFGASARIEPGELVRLRCSDYEGQLMLMVSASKQVVQPEDTL